VLGAFLIVSGPTVVGPILDVVKPNARVRGILTWEGTLLDPLGAIFAVVLFQVIKASNESSLFTGVELFLVGILTATLAAAFGVFLFVIGGRLVRNSPTFGTQVLLGSVSLAAGLANSVNDDSGLLTALLTGVTAPKLAQKYGASLDDAKPFFNTIVSMGTSLIALKIPDAENLLPAAFIIITVTVTVYGLTATPLARKLKIRHPAGEPQNN